MELKRLARKLADIDKGGSFHEAVLVDLMRSMRKVLEQQIKGSSYPILSLYCTWLQHSRLDQNRHGYVLLDQIDRAVWHNSPADFNEHFGKILSSFGLIELRQQMRAFLQANGLTSGLLDSYQNWNVFLFALYKELVEVELSFPPATIASLMPGFDRTKLSKNEKQAMIVRDKIEARHKSDANYPNTVINSYCIEEMTDSDERRKSSPFKWVVKAGPESRVQLNGAVYFPEQRSVFLLD